MNNSRKLPSQRADIGLDSPSSGSKDTIWKDILLLFKLISSESSFEYDRKHQDLQYFSGTQTEFLPQILTDIANEINV